MRFSSKIQRVCKSWCELTSSLPHLWANIDLSVARRRLSLNSARALMRKLHPGLRKITLARIASHQANSVMTLLRQCRKLSYLDVQIIVDPNLFHTFPKLTTLITRADLAMRLPQFIQLLNRCPLLERADVSLRFTSLEEYEKFPSKLENLRSLTLKAANRIPDIHPLHPLELPLFQDVRYR